MSELHDTTSVNIWRQEHAWTNLQRRSECITSDNPILWRFPPKSTFITKAKTPVFVPHALHMQIGLITHADKCKGTSASPPLTVSYDVVHNSADRNWSRTRLITFRIKPLSAGSRERSNGLKVLCDVIKLKLHTAKINIWMWSHNKQREAPSCHVMVIRVYLSWSECVSLISHCTAQIKPKSGLYFNNICMEDVYAWLLSGFICSLN